MPAFFMLFDFLHLKWYTLETNHVKKDHKEYFVNDIIFSFCLCIYFMSEPEKYVSIKIRIWVIITLLVIQDVNRGENEQHLQERNSIY